MAFYEMLPGAGMPSGLQAGMDSVLNKKFGTSTTYPAEGWPDTVNLMGPLPEKTVSGAIVSFPDGADGVPLKKCEITLPASLDGYSEIDVVSAGKNILDLSNITNGDYNRTGAEFVNNVVAVSPMTIKGGANYIMTCSSSVSGFYIRFYDENDTEITEGRVSAYNITSKTFSTPANAVKYIPMWYNTNGLTPADVVSKNYMIEVGSTATTYEPYTAPTTNTADLGRTIYGGTADVVAGQGKSKCGKIVFDGSADENWTAYAGGNGYLIAVADMERGTWYTSEFAESSPLPKVPDNNSLGVRIGVNNNGIYVVQANTIEGVTDLASFKAYLAENPLTVIYPLDDSETFTFDPVPIDSKLGNNTIWSEQGDTEVTYRADIALALGE